MDLKYRAARRFARRLESWEGRLEECLYNAEWACVIHDADMQDVHIKHFGIDHNVAVANHPTKVFVNMGPLEHRTFILVNGSMQEYRTRRIISKNGSAS